MDDGKVAFSTLGLDAATGLPDDGAIAIEIDVGAPRKKKGAKVRKVAKKRPQVDAPVDFDIKSFAEVMADKRRGGP